MSDEFWRIHSFGESIRNRLTGADSQMISSVTRSTCARLQAPVCLFGVVLTAARQTRGCAQIGSVRVLLDRPA
jgi:hypothetical protein